MKWAFSRKNLWDRTPRRVKAGAGRVLAAVPRTILLGRRFRAMLRFVEEAQWWPPERARHYQLERLRAICRLAMDRTPYYRRTFAAVGFDPRDLRAPEDLGQLPTIDRNTVREALEEMCAVSPRSSRVDYVATGGTGGTPLGFYIGADRSAIEYAYLTATWRRAGYQVGVPMAVFRGRVVAAECDGHRHEYDPILRHHYYSNFHMTEDMMARYLMHLRSLGPCFVHAYPSAVATLARHIRRVGMEGLSNVLGIILESENVYPDERRLVETTFGCRCFSTYGHSEKLVLAAECEASTDYHVWPTYGYFELLDNDGRPVRTPGQRGEIVGTGFINQVVPFLRYRTGDYAVWVGDACLSCGRQHPIIRSVEGRWPAGALVAADGSLISMTALNVHDDSFRQVLRFRFYQDVPGAACLRIVPGTGFDAAAGEAILRSLGQRLDGRVRIRLELVGELPLSPRGKDAYVDQRLPVAGG